MRVVILSLAAAGALVLAAAPALAMTFQVSAAGAPASAHFSDPDARFGGDSASLQGVSRQAMDGPGVYTGIYAPVSGPVPAAQAGPAGGPAPTVSAVVPLSAPKTR